ncbi:MAG TPA: hypothetical protein VHG28_16855 [Longimicrobiaceae bacterium]|nr:hypothetical protein [Longimicrobiaceae bacterium]
MNKLNRLDPRRLALALVFAGTLGFGGTQVFAAPSTGQGEARACSSICKPECGEFGGELRHWQCLCCG